MASTSEAKRIRCVCLDVDGVLTDGRLVIDDAGQVTRNFHIHDGLAIRAFERVGGRVIICTGKRSGSVAARAAELHLEHVIQGSHDKLRDVQQVLDALGLELYELAMVADDLPDLALLEASGYPIAVANAVPEIKAAARYVTEQRGGHGAVREAIEHLLRASGGWTDVVAHYRRATGARY